MSFGRKKVSSHGVQQSVAVCYELRVPFVSLVMSRDQIRKKSGSSSAFFLPWLQEIVPRHDQYVCWEKSRRSTTSTCVEALSCAVAACDFLAFA